MTENGIESTAAPAAAMTADVRVGEHMFAADLSGALYWPDRRTLIIADLHLEKGSAHAARGLMLPPYDTRETLDRLAAVIARYRPRTVISLGDSIHDVGAHQRITDGDLKQLRDLQRRRDWIWIAGNHDPKIAASLGGEVREQVELPGITLLHTPAAQPAAKSARVEIAAHLHPVAKVVKHAQSVRRPCFIGDGRRMILPAFGAFTGGLNVLDPAVSSLFATESTQVWMLGRQAVYPLGLHHLSAD